MCMSVVMFSLVITIERSHCACYQLTSYIYLVFIHHVRFIKGINAL